MTRRLIYLTHAEVDKDPAVPVPQWDLNPRGRARHAAFAKTDAVAHVTSIYSSFEAKAVSGAQPVAARLGVTPRPLIALHENDRSATGYLPQGAFEETAHQFFSNPDASIRGWETARAAQARAVAAMRTAAELDRSEGDILIVAHGGIGALLRCHLKGEAISPAEGQPTDAGNSGGHWFDTDLGLTEAPGPWRAI